MFNLFGIVAPYATFIADFVASQLVLAPLLLLFVEEAGLPLLVPGDVILAYVGYNVSLHPEASLIIATCVSMVAVAGGATILFFVSRRWGKILVTKLGKFLFIHPEDIAHAERLFKKYGAWTIIIGRHVPGMRIPMTIFAGTSGMRYRTFILSTIASTILWVTILLQVGHRYGRDFANAIHHSITTSIFVIIAVIGVFLGVHFWGRYRQKQKTK